MSLNIVLPPPTNIPKLKQFFIDIKDRRSVERGIGGLYKVDTSTASTTSSTRVNLKSYTINANANMNKVRVRVYAQLNNAVTSYVIININGTDIASGSISVSGTSVLVADGIADLTPNASNTIKIDGYTTDTTGATTLTITKVIIIAGLSLTSTTPTTILTVNLDPNNDVYTLKTFNNPNVVYRIGVRWWIAGNRKTTAQASFSSNLANEIKSISYNALAGDDGDNNAIIFIATGDYATSFTISGNVGASGDIIIITGVYAQIVLRGNISDSYNTFSGWAILIKEKGLMAVASRHVSVPNVSRFAEFYLISLNGRLLFYTSSSGLDIYVQTPVFSINDSPEAIYHVSWSDDLQGISLFLYVNIVILGV